MNKEGKKKCGGWRCMGGRRRRRREGTTGRRQERKVKWMKKMEEEWGVGDRAFKRRGGWTKGCSSKGGKDGVTGGNMEINSSGGRTSWRWCRWERKRELSLSFYKALISLWVERIRGQSEDSWWTVGKGSVSTHILTHTYTHHTHMDVQCTLAIHSQSARYIHTCFYTPHPHAHTHAVTNYQGNTGTRHGSLYCIKVLE